MAFNKENKITWEELAPSLQELFKGLQTQITKEVERAKSEETRIEGRLNAEINRAKAEERRLQGEIDDIWGSDGKNTSHDITEIWAKLGEMEETIDENMKIALFEQVNFIWDFTTASPPADGLLPDFTRPNRLHMHYSKCSTTSAKSDTSLEMGLIRLGGVIVLPHSGTCHINIPAMNIIPVGFNPGTANTELNVQSQSWNYSKPVINEVHTSGWMASPSNTPEQLTRRTNEYGHMGVYFDIPNCTAGELFSFSIDLAAYTELHNFNKDDWQNGDPQHFLNKMNGNCQPGAVYYTMYQFFQQMSIT